MKGECEHCGREKVLVEVLDNDGRVVYVCHNCALNIEKGEQK